MSHLTSVKELLEKEPALPETSPVRARLIRYAALLDHYEKDAYTPESIWDRDFRALVTTMAARFAENSSDSEDIHAIGVAKERADMMEDVRRRCRLGSK